MNLDKLRMAAHNSDQKLYVIIKMPDLTASLVTEFVGSFVLFATFLTVFAASDPAASIGFGPIAVGFTLVGVMFLGVGISGANYNPAISFMYFLKEGDLTKFSSYVFAQLAGAAVALEFVKHFNGAFS